MGNLTRKSLLKAIESLDRPAKIPVLFYGGYLGLPLCLFPNVPDGAVFGSFRHVKSKRVKKSDLVQNKS